MAAITAEDLAQELRDFGIDPNGTNNPMGQYGFRNVDYAAGVAMGFGEFKGDTASLAHGFDVLANRQLNPGRYRASSSSLADIVTGRNQFDPFDSTRGSPGGIANRELGMSAAINTILGKDTGLQGADADHLAGINTALTSIWGDKSQRGITGGADVFVGAPGTYVNADMSKRMDKYGATTAPGGTSRFFNYNSATGPNPWGFGPPIGSKTALPGFGPDNVPRRPGEFSTGQNTEVYDNVNTQEGWLRHFDPQNADLKPGGQFYRPPEPEGSMGFDIDGRTIWNGMVQDNAGNWVEPGTAGGLANNTADIFGRQVWEGYVQTDDGRWVRPGMAGEMGTGTFDVHGRQVWNGYVQGDDSAWYRPSGAGAFQQGALDSGGRTIYNGYVQNDAGAWVRPGTAGTLQPATPTLPDGYVDGLGRTIWGGYVEQSPGVWVTPAPGGGPPPAAPAPPVSTAPSAADLNGFTTNEPWQQTQWTPPPVPDVSTNAAIVSSNPSAAASTIPGAGTTVPVPETNTSSWGTIPGGVFGVLPLGGSTAQTAGTLFSPNAPADIWNPNTGMGTQQPITVFPSGIERF